MSNFNSVLKEISPNYSTHHSDLFGWHVEYQHPEGTKVWLGYYCSEEEAEKTFLKYILDHCEP
jgi:hypothetical protein